ncbi:MAG: hypothetical protein ABSG75_02575 [Syntrophales bacterium]|jgi:hypothetical protein
MRKILLTTAAAIMLTVATVFAQMGSGQGGSMMGGGWGWGMGYGWGVGIIIVIIVVLGVVYLMKKK